jgi:hypothetical protein
MQLLGDCYDSEGRRGEGLVDRLRLDAFRSKVKFPFGFLFVYKQTIRLCHGRLRLQLPLELRVFRES